ncbi:hypothetical protein HW132_23990 [Brasilonema sp. CT11]|nr:hypothetical protein [Brasilonema sp. CT11]
MANATPYGYRVSSRLRRETLLRRAVSPVAHGEPVLKEGFPTEVSGVGNHGRCYNGAAAFRGKLPPKTCLGNPRNALPPQDRAGSLAH